MENNKTLYIEAQRLFRKQKHGMDVVALELLNRLQKATLPFKLNILVKEDEDECIQSGGSLEVIKLPAKFYPLWEQKLLPGFMSKQKDAWLHCTGNTAPLWGKTPLIVTIHDLIFLEENYLFKKQGGSLYQRFGNVYRSLIVPRVAQRAKFIITVSEFQRQLIIKRLNVDPNKIAVVYNGADERFFIPMQENEKKEALKKYGIDGFPYIFFLANTEPRKNTEAVLKAFAKLCKDNPAFPHYLVIKGLSAEQLEKKITACGATAVKDRIHRVGYIDYNHLPALYQGAGALWFPSFTEGFGLPIVEAMASGIPVITSNCSVMPEIAGDAALYVNPHNFAELTEKTMELFSNPTLRQTLINKGKDRAAIFTWGNSIQTLTNIYKRLIL